MHNIRIGQAVDIHQLQEGRKLILGGVEIEHSKGLLGHSDADVLVHAVGESILGALALGDLGKHFPDTDPKYKGANSLDLLAHIYEMMNEMGYRLEMWMRQSWQKDRKWHHTLWLCEKILQLFYIVIWKTFPLRLHVEKS